MKHSAIDGLRGFAAMIVVITHFISAFIPQLMYKNYPTLFDAPTQTNFWYDIFNFPPISLIYSGNFRVMLFFVISGYVLTKPAFEGQPEKLKNRFIARYLRLNLPVIATLTLAFVLYKMDLYWTKEAALASGSIAWLGSSYPAGMTFFQYVIDCLFNTIVFGRSRFDAPLWSINIEFVGSMALFLFYIYKPRVNLYLLYTLVFIFIYIIYKQAAIYYYAIFLGALLNIININKRISLIFVVIGLYFGAFQYFSVFYNFLPRPEFSGFKIFDVKDFYNCFGAFLVTIAVKNGFAKGLLESATAQFLGKISFSIYLLHFLVLCSFSCWFYLLNPQSMLMLAFNFVLYVGICIFISLYFEKYIDRNSIKISQVFTQFVRQKIHAFNR